MHSSRETRFAHILRPAVRRRSFTNGHYVGRTEFLRICGIDVKPLKQGQLILKSVIVNFKHMGDSVRRYIYMYTHTHTHTHTHIYIYI